MAEEIAKSLRALRTRVGEHELRTGDQLSHVRAGVLGVVLAIGMLVLTATTWAWEDPYQGDYEAVTLWGLASEHWSAVVTLAMVVILTIGTVGLCLAEGPSRVGHIVLAVIAGLTVVAVFLVSSAATEALSDDANTAPGRWLALLAALALAVLHGARADAARAKP